MTSPTPSARHLLPALAIFGAVALAIAAGADKLQLDGPELLDMFPPLAAGEGAILFGGDTLLTGGSASRGHFRREGNDWMSRRLMATIESAHAKAFVINLEGPVTKSRKKGKGAGKWHYAMSPKRIDGVLAAGVTHVSLANNHALDRRRGGLDDTFVALDRVGIQYFGAGADLDRATEPAVIEVGGAKVAILGGMEPWRAKREADWGATPERSGVLLFSKAQIPTVVAHARTRGDIVVAYPHWGGNYRPVANSQRNIARRLVDAGVDAIVGHHGHAAQGYGWVDDTPVMWGLGNLFFGTPGRFGHDKMQPGYGLLTRMVVADGAIQRFELIPIRINNRLQKYQPKPCGLLEARQVLSTYARQEGSELRFVEGVGVLDVPRVGASTEHPSEAGRGHPSGGGH